MGGLDGYPFTGLTGMSALQVMYQTMELCLCIMGRILVLQKMVHWAK